MPGGRPRDSSVEARVLTVAVRVLAEAGYSALTVDAVASEAGVARTTIYRRWPTRAHLVAAGAERLLAPVDVRDTQDLRADLVHALTTLAGALGRAQEGGLVAELVTAAAREPQVREALRALWLPRRAATVHLLERAIARGDLRPDIDCTVVVDQLIGPLYYHVLVTGEPVREPYVRALVDATLRGAVPARATLDRAEGTPRWTCSPAR